MSLRFHSRFVYLLSKYTKELDYLLQNIKIYFNLFLAGF
jgi:hypothetical protein